jgi:hypothetical protein
MSERMRERWGGSGGRERVRRERERGRQGRFRLLISAPKQL